MPLFDDTMDTKPIPGNSNFQYSCTRPDILRESEYTIVTICIDVSYSTIKFACHLLDMLKACVLACKHNPRGRNIILRVIKFDSKVYEIHGFKPVNSINIDEYEPLEPDGFTALYDGTYSGIGSILDYAKDLYNQEFDKMNGVCYIITDGINNRGKTTTKMIKELIENALVGEELEALTTILIQLKDKDNPNPEAETMLKKFREEAQITSFIDVSDVDPKTLAKLGKFIDNSISSHSNSLQSGSPVPVQQSLTI